MANDVLFFRPIVGPGPYRPVEGPHAKLDPDYGVWVQPLTGGFRESYTLCVTGPKEQVEKWFEKYCRSYHPAGYGTQMRLARVQPAGLPEGWIEAAIWRSNSCD